MAGVNRAMEWVRGLRPNNYLRVLPWLPRASKPLTGVVGVLVVVSAALPVAFIVVSGALVGTVPEAVAGGLDSPAGARFTDLLVLLGAVLVVQQIAGPMLQLATTILADRVTLNASEDVMTQCLAPAGIAHLEDPAMLNAVATARGVGNQGWGPGTAARGLVDGSARRLGAVGSVLLIARFSILLALALLGAWLWLRRGNRLGLLRNMQAQIGNVEPYRRAAYYRALSFEATAAKETRLFALGPWVRTRFSDQWALALEQMRLARKGGAAEIFRRSLEFGGSHAIALGILIWAARAGDVSLGEFTAYAQAILTASFLIAGVFPDDYELEYASAALPAVESLRQLESEAVVAQGGLKAAGLPQRSVTFENVRFSYPGSTTLVFDGLDLEIPAGRSLAVVGVNGAGKTTLVKLLARLYDPVEGSVRADGSDLREFDPRSWQQQVGAIFQDFVRYELPARENVGFGAPGQLSDVDGLDDAAAKAGAIEVIRSLPGGWSTVLSPAYTDGRDISGGQWQKIALARALFAVRGGAKVLVLDEPTANLDVRSEAELFERFLEVTSGITTILVSHRFSTVRHADQICVIENGRVSELGSHSALMAAGGRYAEMFELQASRFRAAAVEGSEL